VNNIEAQIREDMAVAVQVCVYRDCLGYVCIYGLQIDMCVL
jgi:hypothetical protein